MANISGSSALMIVGAAFSALAAVNRFVKPLPLALILSVVSPILLGLGFALRLWSGRRDLAERVHVPLPMPLPASASAKVAAVAAERVSAPASVPAPAAAPGPIAPAPASAPVPAPAPTPMAAAAVVAAAPAAAAAPIAPTPTAAPTPAPVVVRAPVPVKQPPQLCVLERDPFVFMTTLTLKNEDRKIVILCDRYNFSSEISYDNSGISKRIEVFNAEISQERCFNSSKRKLETHSVGKCSEVRTLLSSLNFKNARIIGFLGSGSRPSEMGWLDNVLPTMKSLRFVPGGWHVVDMNLIANPEITTIVLAVSCNNCANEREARAQLTQLVEENPGVFYK